MLRLRFSRTFARMMHAETCEAVGDKNQRDAYMIALDAVRKNATPATIAEFKHHLSGAEWQADSGNITAGPLSRAEIAEGRAFLETLSAKTGAVNIAYAAATTRPEDCWHWLPREERDRLAAERVQRNAERMRAIDDAIHRSTAPAAKPTPTDMR